MSWIKKNILYIAWTQSLVAMLGSLYFSNVLHWTPCVLCWYQRILMYPLVLVLGVGILKKIRDIEYIVLSMTFVGMAISIYHNLLQWGVITEKLAPCMIGASCVTKFHLWFGFLSVPLLALIAFVIITICMFIYNKTKDQIIA